MKHLLCISAILVLLLTAIMMLAGCKDRLPKFILTHEQATIQIQTKPFQKIDASGVADIIFVQSETFSVKAAGNKDLLNYMHVKVDDSTLRIEFDNVVGLNDEYVTLHIQAPTLEDLEVSGACKFSLGSLNTQDFRLDASGATTCRLNNLTCKQLDADVSGAAKCEAVVFAQEATLDLQGAGKSQLDIAAKQLGIDISGSHDGLIHFEGETCSLDAAGAAKLALDLQCHRVAGEASGAAGVTLTGKCADHSLYTSGVATIHMEKLNK